MTPPATFTTFHLGDEPPKIRVRWAKHDKKLGLEFAYTHRDTVLTTHELLITGTAENLRQLLSSALVNIAEVEMQRREVEETT